MNGSPIGLIGAGLLGSALAERMVGGGFAVVGYDTSAACLERLRKLGGAPAASAGDVLRTCQNIVLCLPDSLVVRQVVEACHDELRQEQLFMDATTGDPADNDGLSEFLARRGIGYVAATIAGSSEQMRRGAAVVIVGASEEDARRAEPVLATWSDQRFRVGSPGASARVKLVVNLVLGLNRAVLAEGLTLAAACGIDSSVALEILKATPAYSAIMDTKGGRMIVRDYAPQARLAQHLKDVRLIRELAAKREAFTPLTDVHEHLLKTACDSGFAEADNAAIIEAFRPPAQSS
jgi:3-hydroxyisobutyrate dehydrogenase-like beta-hydroxyacid dehydrogenase